MNPIEAGTEIEVTRADGRSMKFLVTAVQFQTQAPEIVLHMIPAVPPPEPEPELIPVPTLDKQQRSNLLRPDPVNALYPGRLPPGWHTV